MGLSSGTARATRPSEVIVPSGMIRVGGVIATTSLSLFLGVGIAGIRVGGIQPGATLQIRITPTTSRSMDSLTPDQVIANVQATLQQEGYYYGDVDGMLGPLTRSALANYQRPHGLYYLRNRSPDSRVVGNDVTTVPTGKLPR
jgi:hypothetical protein